MALLPLLVRRYITSVILSEFFYGFNIVGHNFSPRQQGFPNTPLLTLPHLQWKAYTPESKPRRVDLGVLMP